MRAAHRLGFLAGAALIAGTGFAFSQTGSGTGGTAGSSPGATSPGTTSPGSISPGTTTATPPGTTTGPGNTTRPSSNPSAVPPPVIAGPSGNRGAGSASNPSAVPPPAVAGSGTKPGCNPATGQPSSAATARNNNAVTDTGTPRIANDPTLGTGATVQADPGGTTGSGANNSGSIATGC